MSDTPCPTCTPEQQCAPCKETYLTKQAEEQAEQFANAIATLKPELQTIAMGIIAGLDQITEDQTDDIALFIDKVKTRAKEQPEIQTFLQNMTKCYVTAWQYDLLMRCLNATTINSSE